jgi:type II secretory pathway pseudopilin PulG
MAPPGQAGRGSLNIVRPLSQSMHMHRDHKNAGAAARHHRVAGLTLLELLVVLMVLIAVAGIIVPNVIDLRLGFAGDRKTAQQIATEQTLLQVRAAILGVNGQKGLWPDLAQRDADLPQTMAELFVPRAGWPDFDPNTRIGWRGPYLLSSGAHYGANDAYGSATDPAVLDAWGSPIVIQAPDAQHIRIVSGGEDGVINTPPIVTMPALADCGDDVLLFLRAADTRS